MAETLLETSFGPVQLHRLHTPPDSPLRAWSAADELLLAQGKHLGADRAVQPWPTQEGQYQGQHNHAADVDKPSQYDQERNDQDQQALSRVPYRCSA